MPATPQQSQQVSYPDRGSPQIPRPTPPPQQAQIRDVGNVLADLDPNLLGPHQKREGDDWFAVFNPRVQRVLDVELLHTLTHESVVCCVRFSHDGRYVATGCNRSAQIYEVSTGHQVQCLQDDTVDKDGDLYIRSVCFSPDGKYLATGAEDKQIRVSPDIMLTKRLLTKVYRSGILQPTKSDILSRVTIRTSIPLTLLAMVNTLPQAVETVRSVCGILTPVGKYLIFRLKMA